MADRKPGPTCQSKQRENINDGTLCRQPSPVPGPAGQYTSSSLDWLKGSIGVSTTFYGHVKSSLLTIINLLPFKTDSPYSTAFLKHYVEGSGELYEMREIPPQWQDWIVKKVGRKAGTHKALDPYNSGIYDLRNSLGHFEVTAQPGTAGTMTYTITDTYKFGFKRNDKAQTGRHGFPLGTLDDSTIQFLRALLPSGSYCNPGGFEEHWEIRQVGKETILLIPQQFLAEQGKEFPVRGSFRH